MNAHVWTVPDERWLADSAWFCARCLIDVPFFIDTRAVTAPCRGLWPWGTVRLARWKAAVRRTHAT